MLMAKAKLPFKRSNGDAVRDTPTLRIDQDRLTSLNSLNKSLFADCRLSAEWRSTKIAQRTAIEDNTGIFETLDLARNLKGMALGCQ